MRYRFKQLGSACNAFSMQGYELLFPSGHVLHVDTQFRRNLSCLLTTNQLVLHAHF
jgi:hypothetical protein